MTGTAFEILLAALDSDRETAGAKYVALRDDLIKFFTWRGCPDPEEHADETLDRAAGRLGAGENLQSLRSYIFGIARMLCLEIGRGEKRARLAFADLSRTQPPSEGEIQLREIQHQCLETCLGKFSGADRTFVLEYYRGERGEKIENRKNLILKFALSASGLRMKALRLREKLETCVRECSKASSENLAE